MSDEPATKRDPVDEYIDEILAWRRPLTPSERDELAGLLGLRSVAPQKAA